MSLDPTALTLDQWKTKVLTYHPTAMFTVEDGTGRTYGDVGEWTAHTGPDMQADVVGVYTSEFCDVWLVLPDAGPGDDLFPLEFEVSLDQPPVG